MQPKKDLDFRAWNHQRRSGSDHHQEDLFNDEFQNLGGMPNLPVSPNNANYIGPNKDAQGKQHE